MQFTIEKPFITYELAYALTQSAIAHAKTLHIAICVAIVDPVGNLVSFSKMDECNLIGISTSQGKAYTAAMSGLNTRDFLSYLHENEVPLTSLKDEKLTLITGGLPVFYQDNLIGGIGGGTGEQDEACAQIALQAINL